MMKNLRMQVAECLAWAIVGLTAVLASVGSIQTPQDDSAKNKLGSGPGVHPSTSQAERNQGWKGFCTISPKKVKNKHLKYSNNNKDVPLFNIFRSKQCIFGRSVIFRSSGFLFIRSSGFGLLYQLVLRPPFEYRTIWQPDTNQPFKYQTSPVFRWLCIAIQARPDLYVIRGAR